MSAAHPQNPLRHSQVVADSARHSQVVADSVRHSHVASDSAPPLMQHYAVHWNRIVTVMKRSRRWAGSMGGSVGRLRPIMTAGAMPSALARYTRTNAVGTRIGQNLDCALADVPGFRPTFSCFRGWQAGLLRDPQFPQQGHLAGPDRRWGHSDEAACWSGRRLNFGEHRTFDPSEPDRHLDRSRDAAGMGLWSPSSKLLHPCRRPADQEGGTAPWMEVRILPHWSIANQNCGCSSARWTHSTSGSPSR